jgi:hypothetical protein
MDTLSKYQKPLLGLAIFLSLFAVSTTINGEGTHLIFKNYPALMMLMVSVGIILAILYIKIDKHRIQQLTVEIESLSSEQKEKTLLSDLTTRQKEVYDLILSGKSNKEIMAILFIEQSTIKSHINQIYKKTKY